MENLKKETGKKGFITYKYKDKYIYSLYDPVSEAKRFVDTQKIKPVIITCCGADYVNTQLLDTETELVISFEPIPFDQSTNSEKIIRVNDLKSIERELLKRNIHSSNVALILWHPLIEALPDIYLLKLKGLKKILYKSSVSANTAKIFGFLETKNFFINSLTLKEISTIEREDAHKGKKALVLSPGPSLEDHLEILEKAYNNYTVFALPSVLPFLNNKNIDPHYVIAVDPGYGTYYHLSKYTKKINLITNLNIHPGVFRLPNYTPLLFNYGTFPEMNFFNEYNIPLSYSEGSVFINLLRLLPSIGFEEAIIVGQDFGYKNNRSHVKEGLFERELLNSSSYFEPVEKLSRKLEGQKQKAEIKVQNINIKTDISLKLYYEHFLLQEFDIKIKLLDTCYNPISDNIQKVDENDFISYSSENKKIQTKKVTEIKKRQNKIKDLLLVIKNIFHKEHDPKNGIRRQGRSQCRVYCCLQIYLFFCPRLEESMLNEVQYHQQMAHYNYLWMFCKLVCRGDHNC